LQNRQRFLLEIVTEIKEVLPELTISVRLNIDDFIQGGLEIEESLEVCQCLEKSGVDIINCSSGTYESGLKSIEPASYEEGWRIYLAEAVKKLVNIPVISGGMIRNPEFANQVLVDKKADFIFLGRSLLADPEWVNKARQNEVADIRPCISCNNCIANGFKGLGMRCTVNPFSGRETMLNQEIRVKKNARVVIVGGGPAGMQAAISLRRQGLRVTLYEKEAELGGFMGLAGIPPHKEQIMALRNYMVRELYKSEAELVLSHEFTRDILWATKPDVLVLATGSKPVRPTITGSDQSNCVEAVEVLGRKIEISWQKVVVIGGGSTGCEVADYLLPNNNQVTIIEAGESMAADMERKNRRDLMNRLEDAGVEKRVGARVVEIMPDSVLIEVAGVEERLPVDWVVWATGFKPQNEIFSMVQEEVPFVFLIGDALKVRGFKEAILEGEMLGNTISGLLK
jgi:NADPH-dependent 2,4-dienoyl-CoA reductase/sulfur reductase-like enzyme